MKTDELLNLDFRDEKNKKIIQKALKKIKPLSRYEQDVPIEALEKLLFLMCKKYNIVPNWITMSFTANDKNTVYSANVQSGKNFKSFGYVHGMCLYELMAKLCIKIYAIVKVK